MRRSPWLAWLLMIPALAGGPPAAAKTCALDVVPAATLLLPYFEVDLRSPSGRTTLMAINNAGDRAGSRTSCCGPTSGCRRWPSTST